MHLNTVFSYIGVHIDRISFMTKNKDKTLTSIQIGEHEYLNLLDFFEKFQAFNWFCIDNHYHDKTSYLFEIISNKNLYEFIDSNEYNQNIITKSIVLFFKIFYKNEYDNFVSDYILNYKEHSDLIKKSKIHELLINLEKFISYQWQDKASLCMKEGHEDDKNVVVNYLIWGHLKNIYDMIWKSYSGYIDHNRITFNYEYSHQEKPKKSNIQLHEVSFSSKAPNFSNENRDDILEFLIGDTKTIKKFEEYEKKLITRGFLNNSRSSWQKSSSDLLRFYNYCHKKPVFKNYLEKETTGIKKLRTLYNFHEKTSRDSYKKRQRVETKELKDQFNFLD
ncbi:hypothetical protein JIP1097_80078 [Tenacibaculum maritimum]|nr:hypothetical protein JIP1097_80078 [Tenacibaculum maritimum]